MPPGAREDTRMTEERQAGPRHTGKAASPREHHCYTAWTPFCHIGRWAWNDRIVPVLFKRETKHLYPYMKSPNR